MDNKIKEEQREPLIFKYCIECGTKKENKEKPLCYNCWKNREKKKAWEIYQEMKANGTLPNTEENTMQNKNEPPIRALLNQEISIGKYKLKLGVVAIIGIIAFLIIIFLRGR